jgi:hypothetical protein
VDLDRFLPESDESVAQHVLVAAAPDETAEALRRAPVSGDRLLGTLGALTDLDERIAGSAVRPKTLGELLGPALGFAVLADEPGGALVSGLALRYSAFERHVERLEADAFAGFSEPGFVKVVAGFSPTAQAGGATLLTGEVRVRATDDDARSTLRTTWFAVGPGLRLLVRRLLDLAKSESEGSGPQPGEGGDAAGDHGDAGDLHAR